MDTPALVHRFNGNHTLPAMAKSRTGQITFRSGAQEVSNVTSKICARRIEITVRRPACRISFDAPAQFQPTRKIARPFGKSAHPITRYINPMLLTAGPIGQAEPDLLPRLDDLNIEWNVGNIGEVHAKNRPGKSSTNHSDRKGNCAWFRWRCRLLLRLHLWQLSKCRAEPDASGERGVRDVRLGSEGKVNSNCKMLLLEKRFPASNILRRR